VILSMLSTVQMTRCHYLWPLLCHF